MIGNHGTLFKPNKDKVTNKNQSQDRREIFSTDTMVKTASDLFHGSKDGLENAVQLGNYKRVKQLLKWVPISSENQRGQNLLITALKVENDFCRNQVFNHLVKKGADVR